MVDCTLRSTQPVIVPPSGMSPVSAFWTAWEAESSAMSSISPRSC